MIRKLIVMALAAGGLFAASPAWAECKLMKLAELPVRFMGMTPTITTKVNGQDAVFGLDTGAFFSMVSTEGAMRLGMTPTQAPDGLRVRGLGGGEADAKAVKAKDFTFADVPLHNVQFLIADRAGDGRMAGLLGQNMLGGLDVEYDFANGVMRLLKAEGCNNSANLAYWAKGVDMTHIPVLDTSGPLYQVKVAASIDGHRIKAQFDSGAPYSFLSKPAAARAGIRPTSDGVIAADISYGLFGKGQETWIAPFENFVIGGEQIQRTRLRMANIQLNDSDMLLGADFFLSHRILISRSQWDPLESTCRHASLSIL